MTPDLSASLLNYGMAGIFIIYLIYDRQYIIKRLQESIDKNTEVTSILNERLLRFKIK